MTADIGALRAFRDRALRKISMGRKFVQWYYLKGPRYARWLSNHAGFKPIVRIALIVPVGISKLVFFGNWIAMLFLGLMCSSVIIITGKKRRWKGRNILIGAFGLTFICVMVYSFFVRVPEAYASRPDAKLQQEKVYYMYEDHIGRPIFMNEYKNYDAGAGGDYNMVYRRDDSNGDCVYDTLEDIWRTNYTPFGVDDYSFGSVGIDVGSDSYCSLKLDDWMPPFRFPGQYADPELGDEFVYNHWRFYMPEIGRYNRADPYGQANDNNIYRYGYNNPMKFIDANGTFVHPKCCECRNLYLEEMSICNKFYFYALMRSGTTMLTGVLFGYNYAATNVMVASKAVAGVLIANGSLGAGLILSGTVMEEYKNCVNNAERSFDICLHDCLP